MAPGVRWRTWSWRSRKSKVWLPLLIGAVLISFNDGAEEAPERGEWDIIVVNGSGPILLRKSMYTGTDIRLKIKSFGCPGETKFTIDWFLKYYPCHNRYKNIAEMYEKMEPNRGKGQSLMNLGDGECIQSEKLQVMCNKELRVFPPFNKTNRVPAPVCVSPHDMKLNTSYMRDGLKHPHEENVITTTWRDGPYLLAVFINSKSKVANWNLTVNIVMKGSHGFISITEWPLMIFYMVMCMVYILYALFWFLWSACYWKDLLRIQFWIAGVIFLGMVEMAVFCAEYENTNTVGSASQGLLIFAELLSALKRTLARLLVIIVSLGYGIIKPRLGTVMHRVVGLGVLYFAFAAIEGVLRITVGRENSKTLITNVVLAVIDCCCIWFIFVSLAQTIKTLKLRRNPVKLSLYRHFTNTLIFAIIASIIFMVWTTKKFRLAECQSDWQEIWVDDAFWRFLFSVILLVIMFLWRPSANNQRYAFTPLIDDSDDEEVEEFLVSSNLGEGIKLRGTKTESNGTAKPVAPADEDLKWVEENIPTTLTDVALPVLLDSDEEIMTTKFEMSKME
ncbi:transmembrane protein 87A isoform X1 [Brienomyrus brachyistius]|uniref:transmembrane protein 87A isoform X1 n=1 Tax=Brienomyrus brachyistius TaxID=42636 RepID=UPI0020B310A9|nr:transmembrane protein 87A isoform X1 [Brienomyrus brachyistius]